MVMDLCLLSTFDGLKGTLHALRVEEDSVYLHITLQGLDHPDSDTFYQFTSDKGGLPVGWVGLLKEDAEQILDSGNTKFFAGLSVKFDYAGRVNWRWLAIRLENDDLLCEFGHHGSKERWNVVLHEEKIQEHAVKRTLHVVPPSADAVVIREALGWGDF